MPTINPARIPSGLDYYGDEYMYHHREHRQRSDGERKRAHGLNLVDIAIGMGDARHHEDGAVNNERPKGENRANVNPGDNQENWNILDIVAPCTRGALNYRSF